MLCDGRQERRRWDTEPGPGEWKAFLPIEPHVFVGRPGFGVANVREAQLMVRTLAPRLELGLVHRYSVETGGGH